MTTTPRHAGGIDTIGTSLRDSLPNASQKDLLPAAQVWLVEGAAGWHWKRMGLEEKRRLLLAQIGQMARKGLRDRHTEGEGWLVMGLEKRTGS